MKTTTERIVPIQPIFYQGWRGFSIRIARQYMKKPIITKEQEVHAQKIRDETKIQQYEALIKTFGEEKVALWITQERASDIWLKDVQDEFIGAELFERFTLANTDYLTPTDNKNGKDLTPPNISSATAFIAQAKAPEFIWERVLQRNQVYSTTAKWGHGKTALLLTLSIHIAMGQTFAGMQVERSKVLYLAGENPDDIRLRVIAICAHYGFDVAELEDWLYFSDKSFPINHQAMTDIVVSRVKERGDFGVIVVDTGIAHNNLEEENSNSEMHKFAVACRHFGTQIGSPAVIVLMHPPQGATEETLRSRGGGGFAGQIDGELLIWQDSLTKQIKFWHSPKFRGAGFETMHFDLMTKVVEGFKDNFKNDAYSVVAIHGEKKEATNPKNLAPKTREVFESLQRLAVKNSIVTRVEWRLAYYNGVRTSTKQKAFDRAEKSLYASGLVCSSEMGILSIPNSENCDF